MLRNAFEAMATEETLAARNGGGKLSATGTVTASGDTTLIAGVGGQSIVLYWIIAITDPDETTSPLIIIKASGGTEYYRVYAIAHWEPFTLPVGEGLIVNLGGASTVAVTAHYEMV